MDFTNLVLAPLAAIISALVIFVSVLIRPCSEDRALLPAFAASILTNLLMIRPWGYLKWAAFREGMAALLIFSTLGFAIGALISLLMVKGLRFVRTRFLDRRR